MSETGGTGIEIAVVGMAGRFPGAGSVEEFWRNLRDGVEAIRFFTDDELIERGVEAALLADPAYVRAEAVLDGVEAFDASFFGYTPREAALMDPQHRLFLEHAWEALEQAGYCGEKFGGRIGVYAGESINSYLLSNLYPNRELMQSAGGFQTIIGNDRDYLATHVSYKLNLKGAAISVQTACSTSLVAVHLACQSLLNHECDMVLAGGVSVSVPQGIGALHQEGGIISPDGHCRAFDAAARGTLKGSGVGVVVLKRLQDALSDGDTIHAVIKGSAINNDGSAKVGYTAPSIDGQAAVIEEALSVADVEPETITYVEAHGTGTALGDPIEIAALTQAFKASTERKNFCAVGSVKTNIGHLDAAAGVTGLIKAILALKHKQLPPSLNFEQPNPNIDFANTPFFVNTELREWSTDGSPRRAGVNSFGIGGTNAHVVLEEAPAIDGDARRAAPRPYQVLTLSARSETALELAAANLSEHLKQQPELDIADVAFTLHTGRKDFDRRLALVCRDAPDAVAALDATDARRQHRGVQQQQGARPVMFMFTGQGAQHVGMGREVYETETVFRETVDNCCELLQAQLGFDLREVLYPSPEQAEAAAERLQQTLVTQPALFVVEYALARLWMSWGVRPSALIGHSIGEYVAACVAGVFSLEDALALVATRGRLMQSAPSGAMLAVPLAEAEVRSLLNDELSLAAVNSPTMTVVSGAFAAIERFESELDGRGLMCRRLHTSHALHSPAMEGVMPLFAESFKGVELRAPQIPLVSTVTGRWMTTEEAAGARYWTRQLRETVRFSAALVELMREREGVLLEIGPGQTLSALAKQHAAASDERLVLSSLPRPNEEQSAAAYLLNTLARLWVAGVEIDWAAFDGREGARRHVPLPTYPFERQRFWIDPPDSANTNGTHSTALSRRHEPAEYFFVPSWKRTPAPEADATETRNGDACWLVFNDPCGLGARVVSRLEEAGEFVVSVMMGEQFDKLGERAFVLNPHQRGGYEALMKEVRALGKTPSRILHLWGVTPDTAVPSNFDWYGESMARGFYSLLYLAQTFGEHGLTEKVLVGVVSNNMQEVTGEESLRPEKATVLGAAKVVPQEYPLISCRSIDILLPLAGSGAEAALVESLIKEFAAPSAESVVAYRGRHRWTQSFESVRLNGGEGVAAGRAPRLRERGVYLLTGGFGDLDLALARYLAETVHARLVMLADNPLPERDAWPEWLASHDDTDETSRRMRAALSLEESGAELMLLKADVASREEMEQAIARVRERFGEINGVVHSASATAAGMVQLKTKEQVERVLAPKVRGTLTLQSLLDDAPLDFFILCSNSLAITGVFGQVDYCAANCFLDAFAHHATARDTFTVSINWHIPQWEKWQESPTASVPELKAQFAETRDAFGITLEEGVEAFRRILRGAQPQVIVSTLDFQVFIEAQKTAAASSLFDQLETNASVRLAHARSTEDDGQYAPPRDETEKAIVAIWEELFGLQRVSVHDNFFELGGNSLLAIQLVSRVRKDFQIELPLTSLFEAPTTAGLAAAVSRNLMRDNEAEEIERMLREIESLSPDELEATLAEEVQTSNENVNG